MQDLRVIKIKSEMAIKAENNKLNEMKAQLDALQAEEDAVHAQVMSTTHARRELLDRRAFNASNIELLLRMKQGQDEVEQEAVVTDYSDALLVYRGVVEEKNREISKLGRDKVSVLSKIKNFRKNINYMLWEHKYLEERAHNLEEHYLDLHMLRVTKNLQLFIKGGDTQNQQKQDVERAEAKLEHMAASHKLKVQKMQRANSKLARLLAEKDDENSRLREQIGDVEANVSIRESIHRSRSESRGGEVNPAKAAAARMRAITMRRKLIDLARAQTDEIEFLRQELDRLRQKTFPSFAHSSRLVRSGNPDEL